MSIPRVDWLVLLLLLIAPTLSAAADVVPLSDAELRRVAALGPWPPKFQRDPSNRVSGHPLAIALGRLLFFDPRMSPVGYIACVSCHAPAIRMAPPERMLAALKEMGIETP